MSGFYALTDGTDAFAARLILIRDAQKSIELQYYIWHDDLTGRVMHNYLLVAADRGVRVNAIRRLRLAKTASIQDMDIQWGRWKLVYDHPSKVEAKEAKASTLLAPRLKLALDKAEKEILIVSPYFVPGKKFTAYLAGRVKSGVRIRILTNSLAANDVAVVFAGYSKYRKDLIKGGVELYEFKATSEFIGSFNLDGRSVAINTELGVYFESPLYAGMIHDGFDKQIMSKAYRVVLNEKNKIQWISLENGKEVHYSKEPETSFWKRFSTSFSGVFVPESQL